MESSLVSKNSKPVTPVKDHEKSKSKIQETNKFSENLNPNVSHSSPGVKPTSSPLTKSAKSQKSASKISNPAAFSPRNKLQERKFVVAKKNLKKEKEGGKVSIVECKCKERFGAGNVKKCLCVAYENLRASQEEFFKKDDNGETDDLKEVGEEIKNGTLEAENLENRDEYELDDQDLNEGESPGQNGSSTTKRRRAKLLEEARKSAPENGKVMHLVKAFEKLLSIPNSKESDIKEDDEIEYVKNDVKTRAMKWALPGLQPPQPPKASETREFSCSSFCPSDLILTAENLGLDSRASVSSSWDSSQGSISSRTSNGGRRSRRNSSESCGTMGSRRWKKQQLKVTSQKPFKLRTEQRGRLKEEEFMKKIQEMVQEEEKLRVPIAQGLPWTTDEPECLVKPPVKDNTRPVDLKLHSDIRAVERAEFDQQVAEKISLIEQYKMERERQQKLQEEEEIRRLRRELVPKAQPMPYFDRPFIPRS
ncbi:TPX2 protein family [Melia azedarach]|uniref:TPX2 protein family n=1 Tax=Melia azedarach TaxID=155640 RepID=A0ACC1X7H2_MELAZ|nr:TPX2 protein family [Melia azedarach]